MKSQFPSFDALLKNIEVGVSIRPFDSGQFERMQELLFAEAPDSSSESVLKKGQLYTVIGASATCTIKQRIGDLLLAADDHGSLFAVITCPEPELLDGIKLAEDWTKIVGVYRGDRQIPMVSGALKTFPHFEARLILSPNLVTKELVTIRFSGGISTEDVGGASSTGASAQAGDAGLATLTKTLASLPEEEALGKVREAIVGTWVSYKLKESALSIASGASSYQKVELTSDGGALNYLTVVMAGGEDNIKWGQGSETTWSVMSGTFTDSGSCYYGFHIDGDMFAYVIREDGRLVSATSSAAKKQLILQGRISEIATSPEIKKISRADADEALSGLRKVP